MMDKEMKTIFRNNVIKFIIGLVLLAISYGYIQHHPAEKASIFSGFEVLYQKVELVVYKIFKKDPEALKTKFNLEKSFDELITTAENNNCVESSVIDELNELKLTLKKEKVGELENNLSHYNRKLSEYKAMIDEKCK